MDDAEALAAVDGAVARLKDAGDVAAAWTLLSPHNAIYWADEVDEASPPAPAATPEWRKAISFADWIDALHPKDRQWSRAQVIEEHEEMFRISFENGIDDDIWVDRQSADIAPDGSKLNEPWRSRLQVGDLVDCMDNHFLWFTSTVLSVSPEKILIGYRVYSMDGDQVDTRGRYSGYDAEFDQWFDLKSHRIARAYTKADGTLHRSTLPSADADHVFANAAPTQRCRSPLLLASLNRFGAAQGFSLLLNAIPALSMAELSCVLEWLLDITEYLTQPFAAAYLVDVDAAIGANLLLHLRADVRAISIDVVAHWAGRLQSLLSHVLNANGTALRLDTWLWSVYMVYIRCPLLERQFQGVQKMVDLVQSFHYRKRQHLDAALVTEWFHRDLILDVLLRSHAEVLQRALELFRFGVQQRVVAMSTLWAVVLDPAAEKSRVSLLYSFLVEMASVFAPDQLLELWRLVQALDLALYSDDTITWLVRLHKWLGIRSVDASDGPSTQDLFWAILQHPTLPASVQLAAQRGLVDALSAMDMKTPRQDNLLRCLTNLAASTAVVPSLEIAEALLEQHPLISYTAFTVPRGLAFSQLPDVVPRVLHVLPAYPDAAFRFLSFVTPLGVTFTDDELRLLVSLPPNDDDRLFPFLSGLCASLPLTQSTFVFEWFLAHVSAPWPLPRFRCLEQYFLSLNQAHGKLVRSLWDDSTLFHARVLPHDVLGIDALWHIALNADSLETVNAVVPCLHALYHDTDSPLVQEEYMDQCCAHARVAAANANAPAVARCLHLLQHMVGQWEAVEVCSPFTRPHGALSSPSDASLELHWNDQVLAITSSTTIGEVQAAIAAIWKVPVGAVVLDWRDANRTHRVPSLQVQARQGMLPNLLEAKSSTLLPAVAAVAATWYADRATAIERYSNTNVYVMFRGQNDDHNYDLDEWLHFIASVASLYPNLVWAHLIESGFPPAPTSLRLRLVDKYFGLFMDVLDVLERSQHDASAMWNLLQRLPSHVVAIDEPISICRPHLVLYQLQILAACPRDVQRMTPALVSTLIDLVGVSSLGLQAHAYLLLVLQHHTALDLPRLVTLLRMVASSADMNMLEVRQLLQSACYMWTQHTAALATSTSERDGIDTALLLELLQCPTSAGVRSDMAAMLTASPPLWTFSWLPAGLPSATCTEYFATLLAVLQQVPVDDRLVVRDATLHRLSATLAAPNAPSADDVVAGCLQVLTRMPLEWAVVAPLYTAYLNTHWSPRCRHEMYSLLQHFGTPMAMLLESIFPQLPTLEHFATAVPSASSSQSLVGLKNNGNTCFLNSILQQLYYIPSLRSAVLQLDATDASPLLQALQTCFGHLQASRRPEYSPLSVSQASPFEAGVQQDAQQLYLHIVDMLEAVGLHHILTGSLFHELAFESQARRSSENFCCVSLDVQNLHSLDESLAMWAKPDAISGFDWDAEHTNVHITKQALLHGLPPYLVVHLNRFTLNYHTFTTEKINSAFAFPLELDVSAYVADTKTAPLYTLVGIVVHSGTAQSGHYYSYVQTNRGTWIECNDAITRPWHLESHLQVDCFGSATSQKSAYMLLYTNAPDAHYDAPSSPLPPLLQATIDDDNRRCALEAHFLQPDFYSFLIALLETTASLSLNLVLLATEFVWHNIAKTTETALLPSVLERLLPLWTPDMATRSLDELLKEAPLFVLSCPDVLVREAYVAFVLHVLGLCPLGRRRAAYDVILGWIPAVSTQWMRMEQYWTLVHHMASNDIEWFVARETLAWCHAFVLGQPTSLVVDGVRTPLIPHSTIMGNNFLVPKLGPLLDLMVLLAPTSNATAVFSLAFFQRLWHWLPQADDKMATALNRVIACACKDNRALSLSLCELVLSTLTHGSVVGIANALLALVTLLRLPDALQPQRLQWLLVRRGAAPHHWGLLYALYFGRLSHLAWCHKVLETLLVLSDELPPLSQLLGSLFPVQLHHATFLDWVRDALGSTATTATAIASIPITTTNHIPLSLRYKRFQVWSPPEDRVLEHRPIAYEPELIKQDEKVELLLQAWQYGEVLEFHVTNSRQTPVVLTLDVQSPAPLYLVREVPALTICVLYSMPAGNLALQWTAEGYEGATTTSTALVPVLEATTRPRHDSLDTMGAFDEDESLPALADPTPNSSAEPRVCPRCTFHNEPYSILCDMCEADLDGMLSDSF
ncbi:hypothetical protein SDRG_13591 [Saprolegnia diclina VS20]|uniref:USP domain-containing protein n=1 Tax=Saprolegnia diclina (strain VS20) TaxID=1156394 RepID=T0R993_SAPDV|nr:hypothetical protein SDRG_13591 [Saprolegnia diclina VS20]EQC28718.1 hypothetical protein SDRG_13591 [Saprolegnia diclina VS20]|eukprot:XP_008617910.1 hypothetical protein SDRG_13591 [Saprolegnia diclina VS20]